MVSILESCMFTYSKIKLSKKVEREEKSTKEINLHNYIEVW